MEDCGSFLGRRGRKHRARGTNNKVGVTSLRSPQSCRWLCCVVAMGWVRSQECSSKVVGLSSDGKSNKLCALVVSLRGAVARMQL